MKKFAGPLALFIAALFTQSARAQFTPPDQFKVYLYRDITNNLYVLEPNRQNAGTPLKELFITGAELKTQTKADGCGLVRFKPAIYPGEDIKNIRLNSTRYQPVDYELMVDMPWKCVVTNGVAEFKSSKLGLLLPENQKPKPGWLYDFNKAYIAYQPNLAGQSVEVEYTGLAKSSLSFKCNLAILKPSTRLALGTTTSFRFTADGPTYQLSDLKLINTPAPLCSKGAVYLPANWQY